MHRSSKWIAQALGAQLHGTDVEVTATVETDSREITPGSLFVARRGETSDGHQYLEAAASRGAVAAIVRLFPKSLFLTQPSPWESLLAPISASCASPSRWM